jgi:hypothetical protein
MGSAKPFERRALITSDVAGASSAKLKVAISPDPTSSIRICDLDASNISTGPYRAPQRKESRPPLSVNTPSNHNGFVPRAFTRFVMRQRQHPASATDLFT